MRRIVLTFRGSAGVVGWGAVMRFKPIEFTELQQARFWAKVDKSDAASCWPWTGGRDKNGYGTCGPAAKQSFIASRVAWTLSNGVQADGFVCHSCDNPICCNPDHLWVGTPKENARDMWAKGRSHAERMTHCKRGHEVNSTNTRQVGRARYCRPCQAINAQNYLRRKAAQ